MNTIGNLIWLLLGGLLIAFLYFIGGFFLCLTIIGIPFGIQCFKMSVIALCPFGREVVDQRQPTGCLTVIMNILWLLSGGIKIAIIHMVLALMFAVTIIGIPFARQHIKLIELALTPFGKDIRQID